MKQELIKLGLSKNEAEIYLFLLGKPNTTTGPIIKETKIANSRVYESLNKLISKGLVRYNIQKNKKYFEASEPEKFLENEKEKLKKVESIIPELKKLKKEEEFITNTAVYEGFEGFKTAFKKMIYDCPIGETIRILGFSEPSSIEFLRIFLTNLNLNSKKKKHNLKFIFDKSVKNTIGKDMEKEKYTEVKYMPKGYASPAAIDVFGDYVYISLWEKKPFVFMIKNRNIAKSFKHYFDFLWKIAK
jgi:sugar-specific transcriptional regulator TrmB